MRLLGAARPPAERNLRWLLRTGTMPLCDDRLGLAGCNIVGASCPSRLSSRPAEQTQCNNALPDQYHQVLPGITKMTPARSPFCEAAPDSAWPSLRPSQWTLIQCRQCLIHQNLV